MLSYGKRRWNHCVICMSWRDSLSILCIVTPPSVLGNVFDDALLCAAVWVCLLLSPVARWDGEKDESFVDCWQVLCTLTFPAVVLQWVARLIPLSHHKRLEHTDAGLLRISNIELNLNCLPPLPLWSPPSSVYHSWWCRLSLCKSRKQRQRCRSHPATLLWQPPSCLYLVHGNMWHQKSGCHIFLFDLNC